jgi:5-methylcytosine-specific restriction endonuclease McrA
MNNPWTEKNKYRDKTRYKIYNDDRPEYHKVYGTARWKRCRADHLIENNQCVLCGSTQNLRVHHIQSVADNPDRVFDTNNLQSLCQRCHLRTHKKDKNKENNKDE